VAGTSLNLRLVPKFLGLALPRHATMIVCPRADDVDDNTVEDDGVAFSKNIVAPDSEAGSTT